jgi:hypothetical protein
MPPKPQNRDAFELFQSHFDQLLNPSHQLVQLGQKIDWGRFQSAFAGGYSPDLGAPAKATRLMVGLQYLKYTFNESDESVVERWRVPTGSTNCGNWMVAGKRRPDNLYDGRAPAETLSAVHGVSGVAVTDAYVDKGYRGRGCTHTVNVHLSGQRSGGLRAERRRRRRSAIEPKIGHLKSDPLEAQGLHRMDRCFLAGLAGDAINAVLAAARSNPSRLRASLRKLLRRLAAALMRWLEFVIGTLRPPSLLGLGG